MSTMATFEVIEKIGFYPQERLPEIVKPTHADLKLKVDIDNFSFEGHVKYHYHSSAPTNEIVLNTYEIKVNESWVSDKDERNVKKLTKVTYDSDAGVAALEFDENILSEGYLDIRFTGILNDQMKGFYRTAIKVQDKLIYAASTQFEATDARRCFPCWDEPAIKSTFAVELIYKDKLPIPELPDYKTVALSNMPVVETKRVDAEWVSSKYQTTPKMSTYLLAFIVGPFEYIESSCGGRPIRVYTTYGKKEHGRYALDVACKSLQFYEQYFDIAYPLPKMDLIAIPDFISGAMENWGLITYRETCVLVDPNNTSTARKQNVALVVAHELAHQWFGNLVTMLWWTHLWLNEGFATFMEYLCIDSVFPEYDIWSQFTNDAFSSALELDSLHTSHPIEVEVKKASEIDEIFDQISYEKGASIIRMIYNYIGDDAFRNGMKQYLTALAYNNALTDQLWNHLSQACGKPVRDIMNGWTSKMGYPWISVKFEREGNSIKLLLTQSKFTADGKLSSDEENDLWQVPINAIVGSNPEKVIPLGLLSSKTGTFTIEGTGDDWIKLNPGHINFCRAAYPVEMTLKMSPAIKDKSLSAVDRLGIQDDLFALTQAGKVSTVDYLKLLQNYQAEDTYIVWSSVSACMSRISLLSNGTDFEDDLKAFGRRLFADILKKVTWVPQGDEKHTDAMTRSLVISKLVSLKDQNVIEEALRRFKAHLAKTEIIPADLRDAVYRAAAENGSDEDFEKLFEIYRNSELHEEKNRALRSLGFVRDNNKLKRVLDFVLSSEVRNQDKVILFFPLGAVSPVLAWETFQANREKLIEMYSSGHLMTRFVRVCTENFNTEDKANEIEEYFKKQPVPGAERTALQSVESIRLAAAWLKRDGAAIKAFLSSS